jgi:hypothetical protein
LLQKKNYSTCAEKRKKGGCAGRRRHFAGNIILVLVVLIARAYGKIRSEPDLGEYRKSKGYFSEVSFAAALAFGLVVIIVYLCFSSFAERLGITQVLVS